MAKRVKIAYCVLAIGLFVIAGIFLYTFAVNHSHPHRNMQTYYIIYAIVMLFLGFILFKCNDEVKAGVALLLVTVVVCVYATEIVLEYYEHLSTTGDRPYSEERLKWLRSAATPFDTRADLLEVTLDLRKEGIDAYPNLAPHTFISPSGISTGDSKVYPLGSISDKLSVICNESGEWLSYITDEHGFRNPKGVYDKKDIDFVLIGDSYIQGICVKEGEDIAGLLRKTGMSVLNVGMGSNGPLIELGALKEYAEPLKPKFILWFYYEGNDVEGLTNESMSPVLIKYLEEGFSQNLLHRQQQIDNALIPYAENKLAAKERAAKEFKQTVKAKFRISFSDIIKLSNLRYRLGQTQECTFTEVPLFEDVLIRSKNMVDNWGGKLFFIYLPESSRYVEKKNICRIKSLDLQKHYVLSLTKSLAIPSIDIEKFAASYGDTNSLFPLGRPDRNHFNAKGYRLITDEILYYLTDYKKLQKKSGDPGHGKRSQ